MNTVEVIAKLCEIIDQQNVIIQAQAMELAQLDALTRAEEIATIRRKYADTIGAHAPGRCEHEPGGNGNAPGRCGGPEQIQHPPPG